MPTPSATRNTVGPRMCIEGGASGSFRIGIGSSLPACQTFSVTAAEAGSSGTSEVLLVTSKADSLDRRQHGFTAPPCCPPVQSHHRLSSDKSYEPSGPAFRAQRYLAPRTSTGVSVVYGYATTLWSNRY